MTFYPQSEYIRPFGANQYHSFLRYCTGKHPALIELISKYIQKNLRNPLDECSFLDVGAGDGKLMEGILTSLHSDKTSQDLGNIPNDVTYVEPDPIMFRALASQITSPDCIKSARNKHLLFAEFDLAHNDFLKSDSPYQFILASHVFYYLKHWEPTLRHIHDLLSSNGLLCIVMKSMDTDLYKWRSELPWSSEAIGYLSYEPFAESLEPLLSKSVGNNHKSTISIELKLPEEFFASSNRDEFRELFEFLYMIPAEYWTNEVLDELSAGVNTMIDRSPNSSLIYKEVIFWVQQKAGK